MATELKANDGPHILGVPVFRMVNALMNMSKQSQVDDGTPWGRSLETDK